MARAKVRLSEAETPLVLAPIQEEVAIPIKAKKAKGRKPLAVDELLRQVPPTPPHERQRCLALTMQTTGHSLDWSCRLCFSKCVYAAPCGCGGFECIDRKSREPLVVFTETPQRRGKRKWGRRAVGAEAPKRSLFKPWTWFRREPAAVGDTSK